MQGARRLLLAYLYTTYKQNFPLCHTDWLPASSNSHYNGQKCCFLTPPCLCVLGGQDSTSLRAMSQSTGHWSLGTVQQCSFTPQPQKSEMGSSPIDSWLFTPIPWSTDPQTLEIPSNTINTGLGSGSE